jgi:hypothetical protein
MCVKRIGIQKAGVVQDSDVIRHGGRDDHVASRVILAGHVNQVFQYCQGDALGHIHNRPAGRVPAAANFTRALPV